MNKLQQKEVWVEVEHPTPIDILDHVQDLRRYGEKQSGYFFTENEFKKAIGDAVYYGRASHYKYDGKLVEEIKKEYIDNLLK